MVCAVDASVDVVLNNDIPTYEGPMRVDVIPR